jgi:hypothetical protein
MSLYCRLLVACCLALLVGQMCTSPAPERLLSGLRLVEAVLAFSLLVCAAATRLGRAPARRAPEESARGRQRTLRVRHPRGGYVPLLC